MATNPLDDDVQHCPLFVTAPVEFTDVAESTDVTEPTDAAGDIDGPVSVRSRGKIAGVRGAHLHRVRTEKSGSNIDDGPATASDTAARPHVRSRDVRRGESHDLRRIAFEVAGTRLRR